MTNYAGFFFLFVFWGHKGQFGVIKYLPDAALVVCKSPIKSCDALKAP